MPKDSRKRYLDCINLINEQLKEQLNQYAHSDTYNNAFTKEVKEQIRHVSNPTTTQKAIKILVKHSKILSSVSGATAAALIAVPSAGAASAAIVGSTKDLVTSSLQKILIDSIDGGGIIKYALGSMLNSVGSALGTVAGVAVGIAALGILTYLGFRLCYASFVPLLKKGILFIDKKYGFNPEILMLLPEENPILTLHCNLLTLANISTVELMLNRKGVKLKFNVTRLLEQLTRPPKEIELTMEEHIIYQLAEKDAHKLVASIEKLCRKPQKIQKIKESSTYTQLLAALQSVLPSDIDLKTDKKTRTYLAVTAHLIQKKNDDTIERFFTLLDKVLNTKVNDSQLKLSKMNYSHQDNCSPTKVGFDRQTECHTLGSLGQSFCFYQKKPSSSNVPENDSKKHKELNDTSLIGTSMNRH